MGLNICFPARFLMTGEEQELLGGKKLDLKSLLTDSSLDDDQDEWDLLDQEEIEVMEEISSAYNVKSLDEPILHGFDT